MIDNPSTSAPGSERAPARRAGDELAGSVESLVGQVAEEFIAARERGENPDIDEFASRYPRIASVLRQVLPALDVLRSSASASADDRASDSTVPPPALLGDFRIIREIGRGGMGVVYEAEQVSMQRRVALKILPFAAVLDPRQLQRFKNEAVAAGQLQHQNIVPVYSVGCERGVHFYAMQFIEGQTIAEVIRELRRSSGIDAQFESVGNALRGVPHEGAPVAGDSSRSSARNATEGVPYRATSVTASPLAALTTERSTNSREYLRTVARLGIQAAEALEHAHEIGVIHRDIKPSNLILDVRGNLWITDFGLARVGTDANLTMTGDLLGTIRYMSPEQALAKRVLVDHRTDIYSLGVTLYELLTLRPVFSGEDRQEILRQIAFDEPQPPRKRNPSIPVELETIVLKAMAKNPLERYATAQELADDLRRHLEDKPILARRPTVLQWTRKWARRHQPVVALATGAIVIVLAVLAGAVGWIIHDRGTRRAKIATTVRETISEATTLAEEARWPDALARLRRVEGLLESGEVNTHLVARVHDLLHDLEMVDRMETLRLEIAGNIKRSRFDAEAADAAYGRAFREYGLDIEKLRAEEAAAQIRARPIRQEFAMAVVHWAIIRQSRQGIQEHVAKHLLEIAQLADPDETRCRLREAVVLRNRAFIEEFAASEQTAELPPVTVVLLANILAAEGANDAAVRVLQRTVHKYPSDFWINYSLGYYFTEIQPPRWDDALRFCQVAVALRPQSPAGHLHLGLALRNKGALDEAIAGYRTAIKLKPDLAVAHNNLGIALQQQSASDEAVLAYREAIRHQPDYADAHYNLGNALVHQRAFDEAIAAYREAMRLKPEDPSICGNLGAALWYRGDLDGAIEAFRKATQLRTYAGDYSNLGAALAQKGALDEAAVALRRAVELKPDLAESHLNLGGVLCEKGAWDEGIAALRKAIELKPDLVDAHASLSEALLATRVPEEAITASYQWIRLAPEDGNASCTLGRALQGAGRFVEALDALRRGHELGAKSPEWNKPSTQWVQECERLVELDARLPAVLRGEAQPASAKECIEFASLCLQYRHQTVAAARLYAQAFAAEPSLNHQHRYNAACAATLAGCSNGQDANMLEVAERARLRHQALDWLRADLVLCKAQIESGKPEARATVLRTLQHWQRDSNLAGVREAEVIAKLPQDEQEAWRELWAGVADFLNKMQ